MTVWTPGDFQRAADDLGSMARVYESRANHVAERLSMLGGYADGIGAAWTSSRSVAFAADLRSWAARADALVAAHVGVADELRRLAVIADAIATRLVRIERQIPEFEQQVRVADQLASDPQRTPTGRAVHGAHEARNDLSRLHAERGGAIDEWVFHCRRVADAIDACSFELHRFAGEGVSLRAFGPITGFVMRAITLARDTDPPYVVDIWTVAFNAEASVGLGGAIEVVYEVRRLSNGRYQVVERHGRSVVAEAGVEARASVRWGDRTYGIDAAAMIEGQLGISAERTWKVSTEHEVRLLIARLLVDSARGGALLELATEYENLALLSVHPFVWTFAQLDEDAIRARMFAREVADYDVGPPAMSFGAIDAAVNGRIGAEVDIPAVGHDALGVQLAAEARASLGLLYTADGDHGYRAILEGSAVLEAWGGGSDPGGLDQSGTIDVRVLYEPGTHDLESVTAVVSTHGRDTSTIRTTMFDLEDPGGLAAAQTVKDFALAPTGILKTGEALDLIANAVDQPGVHQDVQTYRYEAASYGGALEFAILAKVGADLAVDVTHQS